MADRQVNGQYSVLMRFYLHSHFDAVARMVISFCIQGLAFVNVGHIVSIPATLLAGNGCRDTSFAIVGVVMSVPVCVAVIAVMSVGSVAVLILATLMVLAAAGAVKMLVTVVSFVSLRAQLTSRRTAG